MKNAKLMLALLFFMAACTPKNPGFITLVNSGVETIKISVDGRSFTIRPANHITKEISSGIHEVRIDNSPAFKVPVALDKTSVFDSTGLSCYVVADYTQRLHGGRPAIIERFRQQQIFTTRDKMFAFLGSYLPKELKPNERALRLQQIDCEIVSNDDELVSAISNLQ